MNSRDFDKFEWEHLSKMKLGITLYNEGQFWECHEELEDHWIEGRGSNVRYVYWALIQVSTALFHKLNGNSSGAMGMISKAREKIDLCEKFQVETPLMEEFLNWSYFKTLVKKGDFDKLIEFKFLNPQEWEEA